MLRANPVAARQFFAWRARRFPLTWTHRALIGCVLLGLMHGLIYATLIPPWQAPDEPMLYEYVGLVTATGHIPNIRDHDQTLEQRLVQSLTQERFWHYTRGIEPHPAPRTLSDALHLMWMPRQVGGDPPLYFVLAAIPLHFVYTWPVATQVRLLRMLNALLLPLVVLCGYGAARTIAPERPAFALAVASMIALHPMFAAIGTALGNDGLANLLGAALIWAILWRLRDGPSTLRTTVIVVLLVLALLTKRTALPYLVLLAMLAGWQGCVAVRRGLSGFMTAGWRTRLRWLALLGLPIGAILIWCGTQVNWQGTAWWIDARTEQAWPRTVTSAQSLPSIQIPAAKEALQSLPDVGTVLLRNRKLRYSAQIEGHGAASGRLTVYWGTQRREHHFVVNDETTVQFDVTVPANAPDIRIGIVADHGTIDVDDVAITIAGQSTNLLRNSSMRWPALRPESPLKGLGRYLRLPELQWALASQRPRTTFSYSAWGSLLFTSFWGNFGWLSIPFVSSTVWAPVLTLLSAGGLLGMGWWLWTRRGTQSQRRSWALLLGMFALSLGLLLLSGYAEPSGLQQGRYLFPVLVPIAAILAWGYLAALPRRADRLWLGCWLLVWGGFAVASLVHISQYYAAS